MSDQPPLILYDGICALCQNLVRFVLYFDRKRQFRFAALQSTTGQKTLKTFGYPLADFNTFLLIDQGKAFDRPSGILRVMWLIGGIWRVISILRFIPRPLRDLLYNLVAKTRYRMFGTVDPAACELPPLENRHQFLH